MKKTLQGHITDNKYQSKRFNQPKIPSIKPWMSSSDYTIHESYLESGEDVGGELVWVNELVDDAGRLRGRTSFH